MISISYAILVHNEHKELSELLSLLFKYKKEQDEIVVVMDNPTDEVRNLLQETKQTRDNLCVSDFFFYEHALNNNFANQKNYLNEECQQPYIFNIDADESLSVFLLENLHSILESNPDVEAMWFARINTVEGLTDEHIKKWGWQVNEKGYVNFPDRQCRLYKNNSDIKWVNPVHEKLTGYKISSIFPEIDDYCIVHKKHISRQEEQNNFYSTIQ